MLSDLKDRLRVRSTHGREEILDVIEDFVKGIGVNNGYSTRNTRFYLYVSQC